MKASIVTLATLVASVSAHTTVWGVWVNDAFQGDGRNVYVRSPPNNNPVKDITGNQINCNVNNRQVSQSVSVKTGDKFTFEWYHDNRGDDIIAASHNGPITVYIAPASSNGNGAVWTKLYEDGLSGGQWAVQKLIAAGGKHSLTLPSWIAPGNYLLRAEIIAHHESEVTYAENAARGAQFYPSCTQITVTSGGSTTPAQNYNFVGGYQYSHPGIKFNLYFNPSGTYSIPGPAVWTPSGGGNGGTPPVTSTPPAQTSSAPGGGSGSGTVAKWGQCGGINYTGPTGCVSGSTCKKVNDYYHQCQ